MSQNARHQWRIRKVPDVMANCVVCGHHRVCDAYDHDLRGHVCAVDYELVREAEEVLAEAHIEQPTDSILDGGAL